MRDRIAQVWPIVRDHLRQAQQAQARVYNQGAQLRIFRPGDLVRVLIPTAECKFLAKWQGPYEVVDQVGEVNYRVRQPGRRKPTQLYHVNLLKQWRSGPSPLAPAPLVWPPGTTYQWSPWGTISVPPRSRTLKRSSFNTRISFQRYQRGPQ